MPGSVTQVLPSVATIVQAHSIQASRAGNVSCTKFSLDSGCNVCYSFAIQHQQQQQIVKVVTASPQANIMNAVQHVPISQAQQLPQVQKINLCF